MSTAPRCVCGASLTLFGCEPEDGPVWTHTTFGKGGCTEPLPAAGLPTKSDRDDLTERLKSTGERLDRAAEDMKKLREQMDAVDRRMVALDAQAELPATVRRATLHGVWDALIDAGDMRGAAVVMRMIDRGGSL